MKSVDDKRNREKILISQMIRLYCRKKHKSKNGLCDECKKLDDYAKMRSEKYPFMETKTFCSNCKVHCYKPEMREKIREVMRFSSPRMIFHHPITAIRHVIETKKEKAGGNKMKERIFEPFKVKDIVFLAIISAVTLCTCAVMPLVSSLRTVIFGIAQLITSLQISVFFAIGLMKIRKTGALFIMSLLTGLFQLLMAPPMFFSNIIIGLLLEILVLLIFRGYKKNSAVFFAVLLYNPLSLPFNYLYKLLFGREAMVAVAAKATCINSRRSSV